jgi:hypothetical protein
MCWPVLHVAEICSQNWPSLCTPQSFRTFLLIPGTIHSADVLGWPSRLHCNVESTKLAGLPLYSSCWSTMREEAIFL